MSESVASTKLQEALLVAHSSGMTWRAIAASYGVNVRYVYDLAVHDKEPRGVNVRRCFSLPVMLPAPTCLHCGEVHVAKRCPHSPRQYKSLFDYPTKALRWMYENRGDYTVNL